MSAVSFAIPSPRRRRVLIRLLLMISGTIRKTQHAAIALDRSILLESAAKVNQSLFNAPHPLSFG